MIDAVPQHIAYYGANFGVVEEVNLPEKKVNERKLLGNELSKLTEIYDRLKNELDFNYKVDFAIQKDQIFITGVKDVSVSEIEILERDHKKTTETDDNNGDLDGAEIYEENKDEGNQSNQEEFLEEQNDIYNEVVKEMRVSKYEETNDNQIMTDEETEIIQNEETQKTNDEEILTDEQNEAIQNEETQVMTDEQNNAQHTDDEQIKTNEQNETTQTDEKQIPANEVKEDRKNNGIKEINEMLFEIDEKRSKDLAVEDEKPDRFKKFEDKKNADDFY